MTADAFRLSAAGFGEALAALGRHGPDAREVRRDDAVGARVGWAADHHWIDAAVVPVGTAAPADDPALPHCLWIESGRRAQGRTMLPDIEMPVMTLDLAALPETDEVADRVAIGEIGAVNDRAYGGEPARAADRRAPAGLRSRLRRPRGRRAAGERRGGHRRGHRRVGAVGGDRSGAPPAGARHPRHARAARRRAPPRRADRLAAGEPGRVPALRAPRLRHGRAAARARALSAPAAAQGRRGRP